MVAPVRAWMRAISTRVLARSLASRLDSGSSSSNTCGLRTSARPQYHPLTLAAGQLRRLALQQRFQLQHGCGLAHTAQAFARLVVVVRPADEGQTPDAEIAQMLCHPARSGTIVHHHLRLPILAHGVDQHGRNGEAGKRTRPVPVARRHQQQSIHPAAHPLHRPHQLAGFALEARHQQLLAIRACSRIDAAHQFGEIFAMQIRQHHVDGVGATTAEAACRMVRRVLQSLRRVLDPAPHVFGHVAMAVQCTRHRGHGYRSLPGNMFDAAGHCRVEFPRRHVGDGM